MEDKWKAAKINISNVPTVHDSMLAGYSGGKQQGKREKQKNAKAPPLRMRKKSKATNQGSTLQRSSSAY